MDIYAVGDGKSAWGTLKKGSRMSNNLFEYLLNNK